MTDVPILMFEDSRLADPDEMLKLLDFPKLGKAGGIDYSFDWHATFNALGDHNLIRSLEAYRNAANFLRNQLSGEAIVIMDLHMTVNNSGEPFNLSHEDIPDDLFEAAACFDDRVRRKADVLEYFNPDRIGVLLALNASCNANWNGIIAFASGRTDVRPEQLEKCVNAGERIVWQNLKMTLSVQLATTPLARATAITGLIEHFLEMRQGPPFWTANTLEWFLEDSVVPPSTPSGVTVLPPHSAPSQQSVLPPHSRPADSDRRVVDMIRQYLIQLLEGFTPPESWFREPQWTALYEALKGLIGACSVSGGGEKNLRLTAVPLLLAAQMAWKKNDIKWLESFVWDTDGLVEIMDHTNELEAREAIRTMAVFLEHLSMGKNGSQVIRAHWGEVVADPAKHLWIDFRIDPLNPATGRSLLQTIFGSRWGHVPGQTVTAYEKMMEKARKPGPSTTPRFSLCIYPEKDAGGKLTRLDFRALGV